MGQCCESYVLLHYMAANGVLKAAKEIVERL